MIQFHKFIYYLFQNITFYKIYEGGTMVELVDTPSSELGVEKRESSNLFGPIFLWLIKAFKSKYIL